jgi:hypothetical protein
LLSFTPLLKFIRERGDEEEAVFLNNPPLNKLGDIDTS